MSADALAALVDLIAGAVAEKLRAVPTPGAAAPEWLSVAAAAERFGLAPRCLADAGRRQEIGTARAGQRTVVNVASVVAWLDARAERDRAERTAPAAPSDGYSKALAIVRANSARGSK